MTIHVGDCREILATLPEASVHTVVTSPPYFGLRDYGTGAWEGGDPEHDHQGVGGRGSYAKPDGESVYRGESLQGGGNRAHVQGAPHRGGRADVCSCGATRIDAQIGLEATPAAYVDALVGVFREVRRVLRDDGTVWLNLGDSYATQPQGNGGKQSTSGLTNPQRQAKLATAAGAHRANKRPAWEGIKSKDLIGIPWMVAFALRADGWYLRGDIVWGKPNPMPESVTDRPTRSHEFIFLLSKQPTYFYDHVAVREPDRGMAAGNGFAGRQDHRLSGGLAVGGTIEPWTPGDGRNRRDVWTVTTKPYAGAHFAVFPPDLIEPCVLAGSPIRACAACGAPWRRLTERVTSYESNAARAGADPEDVGDDGKWEGFENGGGNSKVRAGPVVSIKTLGFQPACGCDAAHTPGVVLDPFTGSGTVGIVCGWHGRRFVGIELSPEYAGIAEGRIAREGSPSRRKAEIVVVHDDQIAFEL